MGKKRRTFVSRRAVLRDGRPCRGGLSAVRAWSGGLLVDVGHDGYALSASGSGSWAASGTTSCSSHCSMNTAMLTPAAAAAVRALARRWSGMRTMSATSSCGFSRGTEGRRCGTPRTPDMPGILAPSGVQVVEATRRVVHAPTCPDENAGGRLPRGATSRRRDVGPGALPRWIA
jgi:hypothetical protein